MAVLGLRRCTGFSLAAASRGSSLAAVCRLLITVASLVVKHGLQGAWASGAVTRGLSSCNSRPIEHSLIMTWKFTSLGLTYITFKVTVSLVD